MDKDVIKMSEWKPNQETKIITGQTTIDSLAIKACCNDIVALFNNNYSKSEQDFITSRLNTLLERFRGKISPTLKTLMGEENIAYQNTFDFRKIAGLISNKIMLCLEPQLSKKAYTIACQYIEEWVNTVKSKAADIQGLPAELDTEPARKYFARAVAAGLMSEQYEWLASKSLLACFCREMSVNLDLGKGYSSEGQKRLSWKPFEALFNVKAKNLTTNLNDIKKTGQDPIGIEKVEAIFKD